MSDSDGPVPMKLSQERHAERHSGGERARIGVAILQWRDLVLVGVRDESAPLGGMHEFPGGKCREGESAAECALRECLEETGLRADVVELLDHTRHRYGHGEVDLSFFLCRSPGEARPEAHPPFQWVPVSRLRTLNFPEGNRAVIGKLMQRQK